jgi:hypothetical protein
MDAGLRQALRAALIISAGLGVLCAVITLLVSMAKFGHSTAALSLPTWAQWSAAPPAEIVMLVVGALCALLLVAGSWPVRVCAAAVATWFVYAQGAFAPGSRYAEQLAQTFDTTHFWTADLVGVTALLVAAVLAIVVAVRPARTADAPHGTVAASGL